MTYAEAWKKEQAERSHYNQVLGDDKASPAALRAALDEAEAIKKWCLSDGIRDLKTSGGVAQIYLQRNDILFDEIGGYARLGDAKRVLDCMTELRDSLTSPDPWMKENGASLFSYYGSNIGSNELVKKLLPNPGIEEILREFKRHDPERVFRGLPYPKAETAKLTESDRVAGLSMIWSEAKYNFANFDLVPDLDWDASYQHYLPLVAAARDEYAYYNLLREFIGLLKDSHTDVGLPSGLRAKVEMRPALPVLLVEGKVVVYREPTADFKALGFHLGDVVEKIDGMDAVEYGRAKWGHLASCSTPQDRDQRIYTYMLLRGPAGKAARLETVDAKGERRTIDVPRTDRYLKGVDLPPSEFRILPDGTAYFAFNTCANDEPSDSFAKHLPEIQKAGKLIIDCRMNDGGNGGVGYSILSHLISGEVKVGNWLTHVYRPSFRVWGTKTEPYRGDNTISSEAPVFTGPVAVLTSARTFSAGEDFVAAFKTSKRGPIVGMPTGGSTGQPLSFQLPGGGWARVCTKRDSMGDGTEFVGIGILPDMKIENRIEAIRNGTDPVLEAALRSLGSR